MIGKKQERQVLQEEMMTFNGVQCSHLDWGELRKMLTHQEPSLFSVAESHGVQGGNAFYEVREVVVDLKRSRLQRATAIDRGGEREKETKDPAQDTRTQTRQASYETGVHRTSQQARSKRWQLGGFKTRYTVHQEGQKGERRRLSYEKEHWRLEPQREAARSTTLRVQQHLKW